MGDSENLEEEYRLVINFCHKHELYEYETKLKNKLEDFLSPFKIMIVGEGKSGKSTLLNALVGKDVAAVNYEPKTWCINLYTKAKGGEYAELVYEFSHNGDSAESRKIKKVTVDEANRISDEISKKTADELTSDEKSLTEIRWYLDLPWPNQDIFIVDTPGFGQIRNNTAVEDISIHAGRGVRFVSRDNFDQYYYKADMILWCFNSDSVNDSEVEEHLKSVSGQSKKIYGIVTKLDKVEDEEERKKVFNANGDKYRGRYLNECLSSGIPRIRPDRDTPEEIEKKEKIKKNSVDGIRNVIEYLLQSNKVDQIKHDDAESYLKSIREQIRAAMEKLLDFYFENYNLQHDAEARIPKEVGLFQQKTLQKIQTMYLDDKVKFSSESFFIQNWQWAQQNADAYKTRIEYEIEHSRLSLEGKEVLDSMAEEMKEAAESLYRNIHWKTVTISMTGESHTDVDFEFTPTVFNYDYSGVDNEVHIDLGVAYDIMQLFGEGSFIHMAINLLAGNSIMRKVVSSGMETSTKYIKEVNRRYTKFVNSYSKQTIESVLDALNEAFKQLTNSKPSDIPNKIFQLEDELFRAHILDEGKADFYPIQSGNTVIFIPSVYRSRFQGTQLEIEPAVLTRFFNERFEKVYGDRLAETKESYKKALSQFSGESRIKKPEAALAYKNFDIDPDVTNDLPPLDRIVWNTQIDVINDEYRKCSTSYQFSCASLWSKEKKKAEEKVLSMYAKNYAASFIKQLDIFLKEWEAQAKVDSDWCFQNGQMASMPYSFDYVLFYNNIYFQRHQEDAMALYTINFASNKRIPEEWVKQWNIIDVEGNRNSSGIHHMAEQIFTGLVSWLDVKKKGLIRQYWDPKLQSVYNYGCQVCDQYLAAFNFYLRSDFAVSWLVEKAQGIRKYKNILEYAIQSGKIPRKFTSMLKGEIPELYAYQELSFSNGDKMGERWKKYVSAELPKYLKGF